jgi:hypothetical protein
MEAKSAGFFTIFVNGHAVIQTKATRKASLDSREID